MVELIIGGNFILKIWGCRATVPYFYIKEAYINNYFTVLCIWGTSISEQIYLRIRAGKVERLNCYKFEMLIRKIRINQKRHLTIHIKSDTISIPAKYNKRYK